MFYSYSSPYLTEFVIRHGQAFSYCRYARILYGVAAAAAVITEDNRDGVEESTWKESWVQDMQEVRGLVRTMREEIVKSA